MATTAGVLLIAACTTEEIVMVTVASVEISPKIVNAVEGEQIRLVATVLNEHNEQLSATGLEWSSDDLSVASVDRQGVVTAHATGAATIRAKFREVSGATEVRVLPAPFVTVGESSVILYTGPGASPEPELVSVTKGGASDLGPLTIGVEHRAGQPGGWLQAALTGTSAPSHLILTARSDALASGMYDAMVRVGAAGSPETATVAVALSVAGFRVSETDGGTSVREGGASDQLSVVLSARPSAAVVLSVTSSDPGEVSVSPGSLRFTPANWSTPQSVTVRGVDDGEADGDQSATVTLSVDVAQSHDAFEGLGNRTISVVNADDDESAVPGIVLEHTGGDTRVNEAGTYDSILVALAAPPRSNVTLSPSSENPFEVAIAAGGLLRFTPSDWSVRQIVVVRGIDDSFDDGDRAVTITLSVVDFISPAEYDGRFARIDAWNEDNDGVGGVGGGGDDGDADRDADDGEDDDDDDDDEDDDDDDDDRGGGRGRGRGRGGG